MKKAFPQFALVAGSLGSAWNARATVFPPDHRGPAWRAAPSLSVKGSAVAVERNAKGFVRLNRRWKPGGAARLRLPMTARANQRRDAASGPPYDGAHRVTPVTMPEETSTRGAPYASVSCGPLLFAPPIPDTTDANTPDPSARWRFALDVQNPGLAAERALARTR